MIKEDYVNFEVAVLLNERGFDVPEYIVGHIYTENGNIQNVGSIEYSNTDCIAAPTLQMAMKWLREVHKININVLYDAQRFVKTDGTTEDVDVYEVDIITKNGTIYIGNYNHYESACEAAIKYCLENLMNK